MKSTRSDAPAPPGFAEGRVVLPSGWVIEREDASGFEGWWALRDPGDPTAAVAIHWSSERDARAGTWAIYRAAGGA